MSDSGPARFHALCHRLGIHPRQASTAWQLLHQQYSEPHRFYHNLDHISTMLTWLGTAVPAADTIEMAIWYHDSVYDPQASDNEIRSARLFESSLGPFVDESVVENISRLILATDPKYPRSGADDEDIIVDIDRTVFALPADEYESYRQGIRKEYAHVSQADFVKGRQAILQQFLSSQIYTTKDFTGLEPAARGNIESELKLLSEEVV